MIKNLFLGFAAVVAVASFASCEPSDDIQSVEITVGADDNNYVYSAEAQSVKIPVSVVPGVNYNAELVAATDGDKVAWFKDIVFNESNTSEGDFIIYLPANTSNDERKVKVVFSADNAVKNAEVILTQEGIDVPTITVGDGSETISYNADEQLVTIPLSITPDANITVGIESIEVGDDVSWVEDVIYTSTIASGSNLAFLLPSYTNTEEDRSVYMIFSSEGAEDQKITFTQMAFIPTVLTIDSDIESDTEFTFNTYDGSYNYTPADGNESTKTFNVNTNKTTWSLVVKGLYTGAEVPTWIHTDVTNGADGDKIVISLDKNDTNYSRQGKVEFTSNEATTQISINQSPAPKAPTSVDLSHRDYSNPALSTTLYTGDSIVATNEADVVYYDLNHDGVGGSEEWFVYETGTSTVSSQTWLSLSTEYGIKFFKTADNTSAEDRSVDLVMKYFDEEVFRITITDPANIE